MFGLTYLLAGSLLGAADPAALKVSNGGIKASDIVSVGITDGFLVGRDAAGKLVATYPVKPLGSARVVKIGNHAVVIQQEGENRQPLGCVRITFVPLNIAPHPVGWTLKEGRNPEELMHKWKDLHDGSSFIAGVNNGNIAKFGLDKSVYDKIVKASAAIAAMRAKVNDEDVQKQVPEEQAKLDTRIIDDINKALAATHVSLFNDLGYEAYKVPAQIYRLQQRLGALESIDEDSPLHVELMYLNRWLIDHVWDRKKDVPFTGGEAAFFRVGTTWHDPFFEIQDVVKGVDWRPEFGKPTWTWTVRPVTSTEKQDYGVDDTAIALESPDTLAVYILDRDLRPVTKRSVQAEIQAGMAFADKWAQGVVEGRSLEADLGPDGQKTFRFYNDKLTLTIERCTMTVERGSLNVKFKGSMTLQDGRRVRLVHMGQARLEPTQLDPHRNDNETLEILPSDQEAKTKLLIVEDRFYRRVSSADPRVQFRGATAFRLLVNGKMKEGGLHASLIIEDGYALVGDLDFRWTGSGVKGGR